jgi:hypothetical protein
MEIDVFPVFPQEAGEQLSSTHANSVVSVIAE